MKFQGALIKERGQEFAVVVVKPHVTSCTSSSQSAINEYRRYFGNRPIILMSQNSRGRPTFVGRPDIAKFMSRVSVSRIPWREYTVA